MVKMDFTNLEVEVEVDTLEGEVVMVIANNKVNVKVSFDPEDYIHLVNEMYRVMVEMEGGQ